MRLLRALALTLTVLLTGCTGGAEPVGAPTGTSEPTTVPTPAAIPPSAPTLTAASTAPPTTPASTPAFTSGGMELATGALAFGVAYDEAIGPLTDALGPPTIDTGETSPFSSYGTCPGTVLRALEYADGAAVLLFGDVDGPGQRFYAWLLRAQGTPQDAPPVRALVGGATVEVRIGTTVAELGAVPAGTLDVFEGDEIFGAGFRLTGPTATVFGTLTDTSATGTTTSLNAGNGCGE